MPDRALLDAIEHVRRNPADEDVMAVAVAAAVQAVGATGDLVALRHLSTDADVLYGSRAVPFEVGEAIFRRLLGSGRDADLLLWFSSYLLAYGPDFDEEAEALRAEAGRT